VERQCGAHKCGGGEKRVTEMLRGKVGTSVQYFLDVEGYGTGYWLQSLLLLRNYLKAAAA
jgi:hypothetical protein